METGTLKKECIQVIQAVVKQLQERRKTITDETVREFTAIRKLQYDY